MNLQNWKRLCDERCISPLCTFLYIDVNVYKYKCINAFGIVCLSKNIANILVVQSCGKWHYVFKYPPYSFLTSFLSLLTIYTFKKTINRYKLYMFLFEDVRYLSCLYVCIHEKYHYIQKLRRHVHL